MAEPSADDWYKAREIEGECISEGAHCCCAPCGRVDKVAHAIVDERERVIGQQRVILAERTQVAREDITAIVAFLQAGRGRGRTRTKMFSDLGKHIRTINAALRGTE